MQKIVILTGAGISAESGIPTFRDAGGLWEGYRVEDVASPEGWSKDYKLVLDFYNQRRKGIREAVPNPGHTALAELEKKYEVVIITQNIDDLHERGGSTNILHLHGEIFKSRSTFDETLVYELGEKDIMPGDKCERGSQLRPHIVWFGEAVPMIERAALEVMEADIFIVIGTSMVVYPAAGLIQYTRQDIPIYFVDPNIPSGLYYKNLTAIPKKAAEGVPELVKILMD